jgi:hypothetical protein
MNNNVVGGHNTSVQRLGVILTNAQTKEDGNWGTSMFIPSGHRWILGEDNVLMDYMPAVGVTTCMFWHI